MNDFFREWSPLLAIILAPTFGLVAARWNRKAQAEANSLAGTGQIFTHQSTLLQDIQEEKDKAKAELKEEREANKKELGTLRADFESFKESVKVQFSGYRAYIHGLRGQVHDLGGVPIEWPKDLDQ